MNPEKAQFLEKEIENMPLIVGFKKLSEHAIIPNKAYPSDSGFDLYAAEDVIIAPGETVVVKTNIALVLHEGYEAQVRPRSGITSKTKLRVQLGTIDNSYRGDIGVIVDNIISVSYRKNPEKDCYLMNVKGEVLIAEENHFWGSYIIKKGDKIAQLVIQQLPQFKAIEIFDLDTTDRGNNGFGSSGV